MPSGRMLVWAIVALSVLTGIESAQAQYTKEQIKEFNKKAQSILNTGLAPYLKAKMVKGVTGNAFIPGRTFLSGSKRVQIRTADDKKDVKFTITLSRYNDKNLAKNAAQTIDKKLKAPVQPTKWTEVNEKTKETGPLTIGQQSYYRGIHKQTRKDSRIHIYEHNSFALQGRWIVQVNITLWNSKYNQSQRKRQKDILGRLVAAIDGKAAPATTNPKPAIVKSGNTKKFVTTPSTIAGSYGDGKEVIRITKSKDQISGSMKTPGGTVKFNGAKQTRVKQVASGKTVEYHVYQGNFKTTLPDGKTISGSSTIRLLEGGNEIEITSGYLVDGIWKTDSRRFKRSAKNK